jgi:predicted phage terminase large subunit-like protein
LATANDGAMAIDFNLDYDGTLPQYEFWQSPHKYRAFIGGIGSGKTFAGAMAILREPPSVGMLVAPTSDMTEEPYKTLKRIAGPLVMDERRGKGDRWLRLMTGHEIYFRSADNPDRLRGYNLGWFWIDEAAQLPDDATWMIMVGRLRLKPGRGWITTTPKGYNWLYRLFVQNTTPEMTVVRAPTRTNILHENTGFIESVARQYHSQFAKQELDGEFVNIGAGLIKPEMMSDATCPPMLPVVLGVDLAISERDGADYTAIVALARDPETGVIYVKEAERHRCGFHEVLQRITSAAARHNPILIAVEQTQYQAAVVQELLRTTKLPVRGIKPDRDKLTRFLPVLTRYEQRMVRHDPSGVPAWFRDELLAFPEADHDDGVDALGYAFAGITSAVVSYAYESVGARRWSGRATVPVPDSDDANRWSAY